ncbi:MAG: ATP-binding cassette domain-containing protein, partial [Paracoccaceae bacterium]|nr:ATP-binding cassette domain-containing protein [Paracoccaceae bacterium]
MGSIVAVNAALAVALLMVPLLGGDYLAWQIGLFLLYGVAAQGVGFAWGRGGFLPLGNALFFGLGAYAAAAALKASDGALWLNMGAMVLIVTICAALAFGIALVLFRGRVGSGPGFSLVTLALVLIAAQIAETTPALTGGFNGYSGFPPLAGLDPFGSLYYLIVALVVAVTFALMVVERLPAGLILRGLVAQEGRLELLGFAPHRVKAWAFAVSAGTCALAGALYASHQGIVTPQAIGFALSAELVIWAAVGGRFSPLGPLVGAVVIGWASASLRDTVSWWEVGVAAVFLLVVLLLPGGAMELFHRALNVLGLRQPVVQPKFLPAPPSRAAVPRGLLRLHDVELTAGGVRILDRLTLEVPTQGVLCVIGPNGAGKTTMLNAATARLPIQSGRITLGETDLAAMSTWQMLDRGIARKMQIPTVFGDLTVRENLQLAALAARMQGFDALRLSPLGWTAAPVAELLADPEVPLAASLDTSAAHLPQGHRQLLELALTLSPEPRLVMLDEPAAGMSPSETQLMVRLIRAYRHRTGAVIVVIEHDMHLVDALADEVAVLHQGQTLARGSLAQVRA